MILLEYIMNILKVVNNMTVNKFINELKHKNLTIYIMEGGQIWFIGTVGVFLTSIVRDKISYKTIETIEPLENVLYIYLVYEESEMKVK